MGGFEENPIQAYVKGINYAREYICMDLLL